jgi:hypothetical protein
MLTFIFVIMLLVQNLHHHLMVINPYQKIWRTHKVNCWLPDLFTLNNNTLFCPLLSLVLFPLIVPGFNVSKIDFE